MKAESIIAAVAAGLGIWWVLSRKEGGAVTRFKVGDVCVSNTDPSFIVKIDSIIKVSGSWYYTVTPLNPIYERGKGYLVKWFDKNFHKQGTPAPAPAPPAPVIPKFAVGDICEATIGGRYYQVQITAIDDTWYYVTAYPETWQSTEYHIVWFDANFTKVG